MKNFFFDLFGKNNPKSIISFDIINSIYVYLNSESDNVEFKMKNIKDVVCVNLYTFPTSLDHEEGRAEIKKAGFNNAYEVLNELYKKMDIGILSDEIIQQESEYDFIHIQFYSEPAADVRKYFNKVINNFVIFFCRTNSLKTNDFKILYSSSHFIDYTKGLLYTELLDVNNPKNETQEIGIKDFKLVLQAICEYLNIEIPQNIELVSSESQIKYEEITLKTFEKFIQLVSRGNIEEKELKKQSKKLFKNFNKEVKGYHNKSDGHYDLFKSINAWNSDWKFDPEDAEYFISKMINKDFNFTYPEETYSHDLFPYMQSALEKLDLELMTYDTQGDNYLFFVANKKDVSAILELSKLTGIEVTAL